MSTEGNISGIPDKNQAEIKITITEAKILKGPKTDAFISFASLSFDDVVLGSSEHVDLKEDNTFHYMLTVSLFCEVGDCNRLNELISQPLILTIYESSGVSKNVKDVIPLCRCSIDFLPIFVDSRLKQIRRYVLEFIQKPKKQPPIEPEVEVGVNLSSPILMSESNETINTIQITLESCYSLPKELLQFDEDYKYIAILYLPLITENDEIIIFKSGEMETQAMNGEQKKKWYTAKDNADGKILYIPNSEFKVGAFLDDVGDFQDEKDRAHRLSAENKTRIVWNTEFRSVIAPDIIPRIIKNIRAYKFIAIEFARMSSSGLSFAAVAYVNLSTILFPGVTEMRAACQLHPLSNSEMKEKTNKTSLLLYGTLDQIGPNIFAHRKPKEEIASKTESVIGSQLLLDDDVFSNEAAIFEESRTYVVLNINLQNPFVLQRLPEELKQKISELIPVRSVLFPKLDSAQKAVDDFGIQICNTAALLLEEYKNLLIKDAAGSQTRDRLTTQDYRKTKFIHELKKTGKYFACKEQIKYHIVKICRDKFMKRTSFDSSEEFEDFLSTLYVYLIDEMHKNLNYYLSMNDITPSPNPNLIVGIGELKYFAADAAAIGRYDLAQKYHQLRISKYQHEPRCWVDYGIFCLLIDDADKAAECFNQALSISQDYFKGLLLYALTCDICYRSDQTETFLLHAINIQPSSALAQTLLGLHYHGIGNCIGADACFVKAYQLIKEFELLTTSHLKRSASTDSGKTLDESATFDESSLFISCLPFLLNCNMKLYAQRALAQELTSHQCRAAGRYFYFLAKLRLQEGELNNAKTAVRQSLDNDNLNPDVWALSGHIYYALGYKMKTKQSFNKALAISKQPIDLHIIYYKLGQIALEENDNEIAKKYFLLTCKHSPSCLSWIGVGRASYNLGDWIDAEEALSEANILDNTNAEVWGYLTLVCLRTGRKDEVEQAYRFACKCDLKDKKLFDEIHSLSEEVGIDLTPV